MHWIYILSCYDDEFPFRFSHYYIGETKRLYRRFWEHCDSKTTNTCGYNCQVECIYKAKGLSDFITYNEKIININERDSDDSDVEYSMGYNNPARILKKWDWDENWSENDNYLDEENFMVEWFMNKKYGFNCFPDNVRGGKYTNITNTYKEIYDKKYYNNLPLCKCGLPCDINKTEGEDGNFFYRCPKKNFWEDIIDVLNIDEEESEPCNFYKEYTEDKILRVQNQLTNKNYSRIFINLIRKSQWLENIREDSSDPYGKCVGGCGKVNSSYEYIKYNNYFKTLCKNCFITKNEELKSKYDLLRGKCLINL